MRRLFTAAALTLLFAAGSAHATGIGVGVYGGLSYPIIQDDVKSGTIYGLRAPVSLVPMITAPRTAPPEFARATAAACRLHGCSPASSAEDSRS